MIHLERHGDLAELRFDHSNELNPFSIAMTRQLVELGDEVERDERIRGVFVWGGPERSFSVGGDFNDLRTLEDHAAVEAYLADIVASYQAVLAITKPTVAAIDRHCVGQGLQVALMHDWRIGSRRSLYQMPELANGVPCPLGATVLESLLGRARMLHLILGCEKLDAHAALEAGLLDELCDDEGLREAALVQLGRLSDFPAAPYRKTKRIYNERLHAALDEVCPKAGRAHAESFLGGNADAHFDRVLGARALGSG